MGDMFNVDGSVRDALVTMTTARSVVGHDAATGDSKSRRPSSLRTPGALAKLVMRLTISYVDGVVGEVLAAAGTTDMGHQGGDDDTATSGREVPAVPPVSKSQDGGDDELRGDDGQQGRLTPPGARTVRNTRADAFSPHWVAATGTPTSHCRWAITSLP